MAAGSVPTNIDSVSINLSKTGNVNSTPVNTNITYTQYEEINYSKNIKLDVLFSTWRNKLKIPKREKKETVIAERKFNTDTLEYEKEEKPKDDKIVITSVEELKINHQKETLDDDHPKTRQDQQEYVLPSLALLDNPVVNKKQLLILKNSQVGYVNKCKKYIKLFNIFFI